MLYKVYHKLISFINHLASIIRIIHYRCLAKGIYIDFKTYIGPNTKIKCSNNSSVKILKSTLHNGVIIIADHGGKIEINHSYVGYNSVIVAREHITISKNCQIAEMVVIRDQDHKYGESGKTIFEQGFVSAPVIIDENVWVASKATILKGVTIGRDAVIGASSLVNCDVEPSAIYVGIPARKMVKKI